MAPTSYTSNSSVGVVVKEGTPELEVILKQFQSEIDMLSTRSSEISGAVYRLHSASVPCDSSASSPKPIPITVVERLYDILYQFRTHNSDLANSITLLNKVV